jgi:hypothetical protein
MTDHYLPKTAMAAYNRLWLAQRQRDASLRTAVEEAHRKAREKDAFRRAMKASLAEDASRKAAFEMQVVEESKRNHEDEEAVRRAVEASLAEDASREAAFEMQSAEEHAAIHRAMEASLADASKKAMEESLADASMSLAFEMQAAEEDAAFRRAVEESKNEQEAADREFACMIASCSAAAGNPTLVSVGNPALAAAAGVFKVIRNEGGGDCAFRAVAQGTGRGEEYHARLRLWYANFVRDPRMGKLGEWMNGCWENMARLVGRPIYVYDGRAIRLYQDGKDTIFDLSKAGVKNITMRFVPPEVAHNEVIHIRWNGCHFELLQRR